MFQRCARAIPKGDIARAGLMGRRKARVLRELVAREVLYT